MAGIRRTIAIALVAAGAVAAPAHASTRSLSVTGSDGTRFGIAGGGPLDGGRADFTLTTDVPVAPGATTSTGGSVMQARVALAAPRTVEIGGYLDCGHGGASYAYATGGAGVREVIAVLANGRRVRMARFSAPASWHYAGSIFLGLVRARVGLLDVRARDGRAHQLQRRLLLAPAPCRGDGFPTPPRQSPMAKPTPDPAILTGAAAAALGRAERRWQRARIRSYDLQTRVVCFCGGLPGWLTTSVRAGRVVRGVDSVPVLLAQVVDAIEGRPAELDVTYDRYGVPTGIFSDPDRRITDDELGLAMRRFRRR